MSPSYLLFVFFALCVLSAVADVYMQHPRGCNDRWYEEGDRQNDKRLFNSQNNARGGYCWGPELTYYEGSILAVEWTNQHACGNSNTHCNLVLQYMCSTDHDGADESLIIRDGRTTRTIGASDDPTKTTGDEPEYYNVKVSQMDAASGGDPTDDRFFYGMNEPRSNWVTCNTRTRNKGLWTADVGIGRDSSAMATRQNNNPNTRYGFECTEERDYYPYWHPSVWKDIVVFANKKSECEWYQSESQNVKAKNYCSGNETAQQAANNENDCMRAGGEWLKVKPWGNGKPECKQAPWNRDNHLGNGVDGHTNSYNWTLPRTGQEDCIKNGNCTCILRLRYNITVGELDGTEDWKLNGKAKSPITEDNGVTYKEYAGQNWTINIDSDQTGRVFQDRSFMFRIARRPKNVPSDATIYNLNVRGKRGNIVQTYPATEYDFVPTFLEVTKGDYIHFQWTGCDNNPGGNQGNGKQKTDRSNIVQIADLSKNFPLNDTEIKKHKPLFKDAELRRRMAMIDQEDCLSLEDLRAQGGDISQNNQNCMILNQAGPRFSGAIVQMDEIGTYAYMSTRNNDFSNRGQKGQITVKSGWAAWKTAVIVVGGVAAVGIGAAVGTLFYVHKHPLSRAAEVVHKIPGLSKV